jgi:hypothetical protein
MASTAPAIFPLVLLALLLGCAPAYWGGYGDSDDDWDDDRYDCRRYGRGCDDGYYGGSRGGHHRHHDHDDDDDDDDHHGHHGGGGNHHDDDDDHDGDGGNHHHDDDRPPPPRVPSEGLGSRHDPGDGRRR